MRKVTKGKRRKSESPSDAESEANGGNVPNTTEDAEQTTPNDDGESAPKSKRRSVKGRDKSTTDDMDVSIDNDKDDGDRSNTPKQENGNSTKGGEKRRKKDERKPTTSKAEVENDQEYEVEKIVSQRTIKGRRQFLVRWKGYNEDDDTWENEKDLNCSQLIDDFLADEELRREEESKEQSKKTLDNKTGKAAKTNRPKTPKKGRKSRTTKKNNDNGNDGLDDTKEGQDEKDTKKTKKSKQNDVKKNNEDVDDDNDDEEKEFEVDKIIDVHFKKNKSREFLIRWKGFNPSDDTWEPEANLNCPDLISKFMDKVEKAKAMETRELRTSPSHTKRYTLTMHNRERRLSRRNLGKERTTYHHLDD